MTPGVCNFVLKKLNKNKSHFWTYLLLWKKKKQSSVKSIKWLCARCGNCVDNEKLYVPDDVLEEVSTANYQMLPKKSQLRYHKELKKFRSE
jgi:hypothetical protein